MARRQQLTEAQIAALYDPPTELRDLARHYTLSPKDLASVVRRRGDHSRPGHALMLLYLRHPGRPLRSGEQPPVALVKFVAGQVGAAPEALGDYLASEQNRRRRVAGAAPAASLRPARRGGTCRLAAAARDRGRPAGPPGRAGAGGMSQAADRDSSVVRARAALPGGLPPGAARGSPSPDRPTVGRAAAPAGRANGASGRCRATASVHACLNSRMPQTWPTSALSLSPVSGWRRKR